MNYKEEKEGRRGSRSSSPDNHHGGSPGPQTTHIRPIYPPPALSQALTLGLGVRCQTPALLFSGTTKLAPTLLFTTAAGPHSPNIPTYASFAHLQPHPKSLHSVVKILAPPCVPFDHSLPAPQTHHTPPQIHPQCAKTSPPPFVGRNQAFMAQFSALAPTYHLSRVSQTHLPTTVATSYTQLHYFSPSPPAPIADGVPETEPQRLRFRLFG
ncbi:hypothetical protein PILCRDRAFT_10906 [Piloderma croceum F 1598]|uniref:Uncharacterized protein n=1 Tax=Piloderma croceum (strain F 1598) TaxID=765440 RepID=A0A0C3AXE0_PILCF|nr:hypothetical protein PILCRDRAFT_10906 [Piloderma croceum F 1598]